MSNQATALLNGTTLFESINSRLQAVHALSDSQDHYPTGCLTFHRTWKSQQHFPILFFKVPCTSRVRAFYVELLSIRLIGQPWNYLWRDNCIMSRTFGAFHQMKSEGARVTQCNKPGTENCSLMAIGLDFSSWQPHCFRKKTLPDHNHLDGH